MNTLFTQQATITANRLERRSLDGREHMIVPATIIVAGVLNGELVPPEALADFAEGWNGRPIPIGHPQDAEGNYIIANEPSVIESSVLGQFFNAQFDGQRIQGEMWLDVAKAQRLGGDALDILRRLESGEVVEVSTGYYAHVEPVAGNYDGTPYRGIQADLVPDHVALLPNEVGACSVADGCGAGRRNVLITNQGQTGVMLAFYLRPDDAQALALTNVPRKVEALPAEELHVTLAYLGEINEMAIEEAWLLDMARWIASNSVLVTCDLNGHGRFLNAEENGDMEPAFVIVQSEQLYHFRHQLVEMLEDAECGPDRFHVYLPHITLAYAPAGVEVPLQLERRALVFDQLAVSWGDRTITFPLQGQLREETLTMNKQEKEQAKVEAKKKPIANEEGVAAEVVDETPTATETPEQQQPAATDESTVFGGILAEFGGAAGLREALAALTTNAQAQRQTITARLTANRQCAFSADDLAKMDLAQIIKLDRTLTPANYGGQGGMALNSAADEEWAEYTAPVVK